MTSTLHPSTDPSDRSASGGQQASGGGGEPRAATASRPPLARTLLTRFGLIGIWLIVIAAFGILNPSQFLSASNFQTIVNSQVPLLIVALAVMVPLAAGEFDLSIAGVMSFAIVLLGYLNVQADWGILLAILATLCAAVAVGLINSLFIIVVGVESLIVTIGMGTLLVGAGYGISTATSVGLSEGFLHAVQSQPLLGLQWSVFYALALVLVIWYVFSATPLGRYLFFVGGARDAAKLAGVRVNAVRFTALMTSSVLAAVAGIVVVGSLGASAPNVGETYLLPALTAAFLGATVITPRRFNPWGTVVATYFLITGITGLQLQGLVGWIEQVFYGGVLVLAVAASRLAGRYAESAR